MLVAATAVARLHDAAGQDDPVAIQASLDAGAALDERDSTGQTPLMYSVLHGYTNAVRYLLSAGADTSIGENDGYTPMHGAGESALRCPCRAHPTRACLRPGIRLSRAR